MSAFTKILPEKNLKNDCSDIRFIDLKMRASFVPKGIWDAIIQPRTDLILKRAANSDELISFKQVQVHHDLQLVAVLQGGS